MYPVAQKPIWQCSLLYFNIGVFYKGIKMRISSYMETGHLIEYDIEKKEHRYADNNELWDSKNPRPCIKCNQHVGPSRHDPCIENLPGVKFACCGHGDEYYAYVAFEDGTVYREQEALLLQKKLVEQRNKNE